MENYHLASDHQMKEFQPLKLRPEPQHDNINDLLAKFIVNQFLPFKVVEDKYLKYKIGIFFVVN